MLQLIDVFRLLYVKLRVETKVIQKCEIYFKSNARIARENRLLSVPIPFSLNMLSRFSFLDEVHALH